MASIAIFMRPDRIGVSRIKNPGNKPCMDAVRWQEVEDAEALLKEPMLLASMLRELIGDEKRYDVYLNLWPAAYRTIMFSHGKRSGGDVNRLRRSELETVFRGEHNQFYTYDLILNRGRVDADGKCHRLIYAAKKEMVNLLLHALREQKLSLKRIAPADAVFAESVLRYWTPDKKKISVGILLDEGSTSIAFYKGGVIRSLRSLPDGFDGVLRRYRTITGLDSDGARQMIISNGVHVPEETYEAPALMDDVLRLLNRVANQIAVTLHTLFGEEARLDQVLLCGNFVHTEGLVEHLNTLLQVECAVAGDKVLSPNRIKAIALDEQDLEELFPFAAGTSTGVDLLAERRKRRSDIVQTSFVCTVLGLAAVGIMVIMPMNLRTVNQEKQVAQDLLATPEYMFVQDAFDRKKQILKDKEKLIEAIARLPHGMTDTAGILVELRDLTNEYGTVDEVSIDRNAKKITLSFTTESYNAFVLWQSRLMESERFSLVEPPTFSGNGIIFKVNALLTAADFDAAAQNGED